jgi:hypothetical protein
MPTEINYVDSFQTRVFQSFVNLTKSDSTKYPAVTTVRIEPPLLNSTNTDLLTSYTIYDQWAIRVASLSGF